MTRSPEAVPLRAIVAALLNPAVVVGALGYFVDIYDLILFAVVRTTSLKSFGFSGDQLITEGTFLINIQMAGMLAGGLLWGLLGDWRGRLNLLFGSIVLYSAANLANAFVHDPATYAICRFIAGVGLAGELGGSITLVSEVLPRLIRGYGTMLVSAIGVLGAVAAGWVGQHFDWRTAYMIGGVLGLLLLLLRLGVRESRMFQTMSERKPRFAAQLLLLLQPRRLGRYLCCILIGLPCWYVIGLVILFSPEFAKALGTTGPVLAGSSVAISYTGICLGDLASGFLCQVVRGRKTVLLTFMVATFAVINLLFLQKAPSPVLFYALLLLLGFCVGYWSVFVTVAAEHFGTNLRATVATTVPNFARGALIPITLLFTALKPHWGVLHSGLAIGWLVIAAALAAVVGLRETFHEDLDYVEE